MYVGSLRLLSLTTSVRERPNYMAFIGFSKHPAITSDYPLTDLLAKLGVRALSLVLCKKLFLWYNFLCLCSN